MDQSQAAICIQTYTGVYGPVARDWPMTRRPTQRCRHTDRHRRLELCSSARQYLSNFLLGGQNYDLTRC